MCAAGIAGANSASQVTSAGNSPASRIARCASGNTSLFCKRAEHRHARGSRVVHGDHFQIRARFKQPTSFAGERGGVAALRDDQRGERADGRRF